MAGKYIVGRCFKKSLITLVISQLCVNVAVASNVLEETIVTATKRAESIQDVAASILNFNADSMRDANVREFNDLINLTPGATFVRFSPNQGVITIRGIGSADDGAAGDAATAVHLDGIFLSRDGSRDIAMYDMDRVEVLRGPQGTLYGKNALAGVVNYITSKPHADNEFSAELTAGDYDLLEIKAAGNTAATESLFFRAAINVTKRDGYFENLPTGNDVGDADNQSIRLSSHYEASDSLTVLVVADYAKDDTYGTARKLRPEFGPDFLASGLGLGIPNTTDDVGKVELNTDGTFERDSGGVLLQIDKDFGAGTLTWLSGYRSTDYVTNYDLDASLRAYRVQDIEEDSTQFSSELRFASAAAESRGDVEYTVGAYYLTVDTDRLETQFSWLGMTLDELISNPNVPPIPQDTQQYHDQSVTTDSYAVFADGKYKFTEALTGILGVRYSDETKDFEVDAFCGWDGIPNGPGQAGPGNSNSCDPLVVPDENGFNQFSAAADESWSSVTFRAGLEYVVNDDSLAYFTFSNGFKSGGFGPGAATQESAETPFDEELADSYEIGYKTEFWGGRARANTAVFYTEYTDLQIGILNPTSGALTVENAAEAESKGIEIDVAAALTDSLTVQAGYSYVDAEYSDYGEFTGNPLVAPEHSATVSANYDIAIGDAVLTLHGDYSYKDEYFQFADLDPRHLTPSSEIVNLRATYMPESGAWYAAIWGKNVTDEEQMLQIVPVPYSIGSNSAQVAFGPPATYGVTVGFDF
jgi:iron complex outermembrane receptor protein